MNIDRPKTPREEVEAKLTALLLGELPPDEAFALGRIIERDAELAKLYSRLEQTIGLVREAAARPVEQPVTQSASLKLSDSRREKLLAHFKTVTPKEFAEPRKPAFSGLVPAAAAAAVVVLLAAVALPNFVKTRTTSMSNAIINNLRQIDGAKQQWALENHKSANDQPTMKDLEPYLKREFPPLAGETYVVGRVGESAAADLRAGRLSDSLGSWSLARRSSSDNGQRIRLLADGRRVSVERSGDSVAMLPGGEQRPAPVAEQPAPAAQTVELAGTSGQSRSGGIFLPSSADFDNKQSLLTAPVPSASTSSVTKGFLGDPAWVGVLELPAQIGGGLGGGGAGGGGSGGAPVSPAQSISGVAVAEAQAPAAASLDNMHSKQGNVGLADGALEAFNRSSLQDALKNSGSKELADPLHLDYDRARESLQSFAPGVPSAGGGGRGGSGGGGVAGGGGGADRKPPASPPTTGQIVLLNQDKGSVAVGTMPRPEEEAFRRRFGIGGAGGGGALPQEKRPAEPVAIVPSSLPILPSTPATSQSVQAVDPTTGLPVAVVEQAWANPPVRDALAPGIATTAPGTQSSVPAESGAWRQTQKFAYAKGQIADGPTAPTDIVDGYSHGEPTTSASPARPTGSYYGGAGFGGYSSIQTLGKESDNKLRSAQAGDKGAFRLMPSATPDSARNKITPAEVALSKTGQMAATESIPKKVSQEIYLGKALAQEEQAKQAYDADSRHEGPIQLSGPSNVYSLDVVGYANVATNASVAYLDAKRELEELQRFQQILNWKISSEGSDTQVPRGAMVEIVDQAKPQLTKKPGVSERIREATGGGVERSARIKLERDQADISGLAGKSSAAAYDPYFIQTENEVIRSEAVLGKVIDDLELGKAWAKKEGKDQALSKPETLALLRRKLDVRPERNTNVLDIGVRSDSPEEAAKIANAVSEAYRDHRVQQRLAMSRAGINALDLRYNEQQAKVEAAQKKVDELQKELQIRDAVVVTNSPATLVASRDLSDIEVSRLQDKTKAEEKVQQAQAKEPDEPVKLRAVTPAPEPQPEFQVRENAFSTFSMNVSDVSFKLAAASLEKGQMPDVASIRSEEFINAFDYRDPEAAMGAPVAFAWERARYPFAHNRDLLRFSIKTAAAGRQPGRPLNVVLLLDNSGSMERADRVQIIHEALKVLAGQLQAQDKLSVVTFARTSRLWVDGVTGDQARKVAEELSGLTPQGGTNLEEAMNLAYKTAARHYLANGINRVVLLTDGAANLGDVEPESLKQKVEAQRKQGIALDCFGIGWEGFNDDLLEVLSRHGDGRYGFINRPEEAATEFAGQLAGALHVAAADVKVQVEFNPNRVTAYRQIGYAKYQLTKEQFRDNTVDAAEIGAAESGNALYVIETNPSGQGAVATVRVRYKIPATGDYREQEWPVPYTGSAISLEQTSAAMRLAASSSAFSEWLAGSPYATEVTPDRLLGYLRGVPEVYGADARPKKLEWMIRQARSLSGK